MPAPPSFPMPPSFGCLKCEALCKPFVGLLLSVPPTLVSLTLSVHFPVSDPPLFVCGLQSGMQNLSQVGSPLLSPIVSPVSLSLSWRAWFSMPWFLHLKNELSCSTHLTGIELMYIKCLEQGLVPHEHWLSVGCCYSSSSSRTLHRHCAALSRALLLMLLTPLCMQAPLSVCPHPTHLLGQASVSLKSSETSLL